MSFEVKKIAIASDHGGFELKSEIVKYLDTLNIKVLDLGTDSKSSVDYPDFAHNLADKIKSGVVEYGIIICGTGIGISIAANRHKEIRAGLCHDVTTTKLTRMHNDANVLALGARIIGVNVALDCVDAFISTEFEGGRHADRITKI